MLKKIAVVLVVLVAFGAGFAFGNRHGRRSMRHQIGLELLRYRIYEYDPNCVAAGWSCIPEDTYKVVVFASTAGELRIVQPR